MTEMFQKNYLQILEKCGDKEKIAYIKDMMATVTEEVESMLLDESKTRPLASDEVDFLRSARLIDKLKLNRTKTGRQWARHNSKVRFSPYNEVVEPGTCIASEVVEPGTCIASAAHHIKPYYGPSPYGLIAESPKIEEIDTEQDISDEKRKRQKADTDTSISRGQMLTYRSEINNENTVTTEYMTEKFTELKIH